MKESSDNEQKVDRESKICMPRRHLNKVWHMEDLRKDGKVRDRCESMIHYTDAIFVLNDGEPSLSVTNKLVVQPTDMEDVRVHVKDDMVEVDLGDTYKSRPTYICAHLSTKQKEQMT
ncbi:hypothetical protein ACH5RR_008635 [Cinchona calisaya]|uniref:Uncharacterized protein n=1 Tax=Cinchona calisaya TaxID=153742 RepID=A0ABD3ADU3_9GENT